MNILYGLNIFTGCDGSEYIHSPKEQIQSVIYVADRHLVLYLYHWGNHELRLERAEASWICVFYKINNRKIWKKNGIRKS